MLNQLNLNKFWLFLLWLPMISHSQTTIIVVRTSYGIFVGSDTKRGTTLYDTVTNTVISQNSDTTCKIHKYEDVHYAIAGAKPELIIGEIEKSIAPKKSFENTLSDVIKNVLSQRISYLKDLQKNHKSIFENRFEELRSLEVALFGYEKNIPKTVRIVFSIITQKNLPVVIKDTIESKNFNPPVFKNEFIPFPMGHAEEIKNIMFTREFWLKKAPSKAIEELIMIEAKAHPESVAVPIDLLLITDKGDKWLQGPAKPSF